MTYPTPLSNFMHSLMAEKSINVQDVVVELDSCPSSAGQLLTMPSSSRRRRSSLCRQRWQPQKIQSPQYSTVDTCASCPQRRDSFSCGEASDIIPKANLPAYHSALQMVQQKYALPKRSLSSIDYRSSDSARQRRWTEGSASSLPSARPMRRSSADQANRRPFLGTTNLWATFQQVFNRIDSLNHMERQLGGRAVKSIRRKVDRKKLEELVQKNGNTSRERVRETLLKLDSMNHMDRQNGKRVARSRRFDSNSDKRKSDHLDDLMDRFMKISPPKGRK